MKLTQTFFSLCSSQVKHSIFVAALLTLLTLAATASVPALAFDLAPNSLILTHTTKRYQSGDETIRATQNLVASHLGPVIALTDEPLESSTRWYALPLSKMTNEFHSDAGEHDLRVPEFTTTRAEPFSVTMAGGYLSACLGNSIRQLVASFLLEKTDAASLTIHLPMRAIYTGFINEEGHLTPSTPYQEASLDLSMDGLNLEQVIRLIDLNSRKEFLKETIEIAVTKGYVLEQISSADYDLKVFVDKEFVTQSGSDNGKKKVRLIFESAPL